MIPRALVLVLAFAALGCGARTELGDDANETSNERAYTRIGVLGNRGGFDESALEKYLGCRFTFTRTQTDGAPLAREDLDAFDLVVLDQLVRDYTPDEAHAFASWVEDGGGAISLTGFVNAPPDTTRPNSLVADLGLAYEEPILDAAEFNGDVTEFADHPLTRKLTAVPFFGGYVVSHTAADTTEIAFSHGKTLAAAREVGNGRVYLWGDEWVEFTKEWEASDQPKIFWKDAIAWLSHED